MANLTLSTRSVKPNYSAILSHRTTVSLETYPLLLCKWTLFVSWRSRWRLMPSFAFYSFTYMTTDGVKGLFLTQKRFVRNHFYWLRKWQSSFCENGDTATVFCFVNQERAQLLCNNDDNTVNQYFFFLFVFFLSDISNTVSVRHGQQSATKQPQGSRAVHTQHGNHIYIVPLRTTLVYGNSLSKEQKSMCCWK